MCVTQEVNAVSYNAKPWAYYFYVEIKIYVDCWICIRVPLNKSAFLLTVETIQPMHLHEKYICQFEYEIIEN